MRGNLPSAPFCLCDERGGGERQRTRGERASFVFSSSPILQFLSRVNRSSPPSARDASPGSSLCRRDVRLFSAVPTLRERECTTRGVDVMLYDALSLAREASKEQRNVVAGASELVVMTREIFFPNDSVSRRTNISYPSSSGRPASTTTTESRTLSPPKSGSSVIASGVGSRDVTPARARRFRSGESSDA